MHAIPGAGLVLFDARASALAGVEVPSVAEMRAGLERVRAGEPQGDVGPADFLHLARVGSNVQPAEQLMRIRAWGDELVERGVRDVLWIGLGGSGLGPRVLVDALATRATREGVKDKPRPRVRVVDTLCVDGFGELLHALDPWRTHVVLVSKSGSTAETVMLGGMALRWLEAAGASPSEALTIVCGPGAGAMAGLAASLGVTPFEIPPGVGGRWSVLTPVGLLVAAAIGVDLDELLAGAAAVDADYLAGGTLVTRWADVLLRALLDGRRTVPMVVYGQRLERLASWAQQLLMESLGKRVDRAGAEVRRGLTVLAARGPADNHSMLQEWLEGPRDKLAAFVVALPRSAGTRLPEPLVSDERLSGFAAHTPAAVQLALYRGTADALEASGVPSTTLVVERVGARSVGGLLFALELACALVAEGLDVNAYDQPGVEDGKRRARETLASLDDGESEPDEELRVLFGSGDE